MHTEKDLYEKTVYRVSVVTLTENIILSAIKAAVGVLANSKAIIADSIHSLSDVLSTVVVIIGVKLSRKNADKRHPYGHERFECVAAVILSTILIFTGAMLGFSAAKGIFELSSGKAEPNPPGKAAIYAAVLSIAVKEAMYWYTIKAAKKIGSTALKADAWHHRSDAFSSVGSLAAVVGARMGFYMLDSVAGLIIAAIIVKVGVDIFKDAIIKMTDTAADEKIEEKMIKIIAAQNGVKRLDRLYTRMFSDRIYADVEISVENSLSLCKAHEIAHDTQNALKSAFKEVKCVMVHINPYFENGEGEIEQSKCETATED